MKFREQDVYKYRGNFGTVVAEITFYHQLKTIVIAYKVKLDVEKLAMFTNKIAVFNSITDYEIKFINLTQNK